MSGQVYVCFVRGENEDFVRRLLDVLTAEFLGILTAEPRSSETSEDAIVRAIDQSEFVVAVVGRKFIAHATPESHVVKELQHASVIGRPIVPIYIDGVTSKELPNQLGFLANVPGLFLSELDVYQSMKLRSTVLAIQEAATLSRQKLAPPVQEILLGSNDGDRADELAAPPARSITLAVSQQEAAELLAHNRRQRSALDRSPPPPMAAAPPQYASKSQSGLAGLALFGLAAGAVAWLIANGTALTLVQQLMASLNLKLNSFGIFGFLMRTPQDQPRHPEPPPKQKTERDLVNCSVFSPPTVPDGGCAMVQVFLHVPQDASRASQAAHLMDTSTAFRGIQTLDVEIARGTRVEVVLSCPDLVIAEPVQSLIWRGEPVFAQFLVKFPMIFSLTDQTKFHFTTRVVVDGALVGRVMFTVDTVVADTVANNEPAGHLAQTYRNAFVSYASEDRKAVLERVQMLKATRMQFFQDILSLDPGARWEREIYRRIDECDLFLLFWSQSAKSSEWVIREAEYALARQQNSNGRAPDIAVIALEGPPPVLPPASLAGLHVDDPIRYVIAAS